MPRLPSTQRLCSLRISRTDLAWTGGDLRSPRFENGLRLWGAGRFCFCAFSVLCLICWQGPGLAPAGEILSLVSPKDKYPKKRRPECLCPCASLRANLRHAIQAAVQQNSLCAARAAQTRCRNSDEKILALFGANARSLNRVPQAQPDGWERTARKTCGEIRLKRLSELLWQLSNLSRSYPVSGIAPCAHACDGSLLWRATAPESADASSSLLRQCV